MVTAFASGASAPADFNGFARAGHPVGVAIQEVGARVFAAMIEANKSGVQIFVDSGAYTAFTKGRRVDFDAVLDKYARLVDACERPELLHLVAPDVIGDMNETARLQSRHIEQLRELSDRGARIIAPLQTGWRRVEYGSYLDYLGSEIRTLIPGFAFNKMAWSAKDVAELARLVRPASIHLFGIGQKRIARAAEAIWSACPATAICCDSNRIRAWAGKGRALTREISQRLRTVYERSCQRYLSHYLQGRGLCRAEAAILSDVFLGADETELQFDLCNTPGFLEPDEARALAKLFGRRERAEIQSWVKASQSESGCDKENFLGISYGCELGYLIDENDPSYRGLLTQIPAVWPAAMAAQRTLEARPQARTRVLGAIAGRELAQGLPETQTAFAFGAAAGVRQRPRRTRRKSASKDPRPLQMALGF